MIFRSNLVKIALAHGTFPPSSILEHSEEAGIDLGIKAQEQSDDKDRSQDDLSLTVYKFLIQPKKKAPKQCLHIH